MQFYYPTLIPNVRRGGRYADSAHFAPPHPHTWAQVYPRPTPELMQAHNRLWDTILRHLNPMEAMNQCMELLLDDVEGANCPHNDVEEEQNGCEGEQQDGHVGSEPGEYGGMPPQEPPPPYQLREGMVDYYGDLRCYGRR